MHGSFLGSRDVRVLVTGSNGVFGGAFAAHIGAARPDTMVFGVDLRPPVGVPGEACDLTDATAVAGMLARLSPQAVFHFAGAVTGHDLMELTDRLVTPTHTLLDALATHAPGAVLVVPGSAAEYGTLPLGRTSFAETDEPLPVSPYGIAKLAQTRVALEAVLHGADVRVGRVFNVIGPGIPASFLTGSVASQLAAIAAGDAPPRIELGPLSSVRDFVDIRDACDGLLAIAERGAIGRVYNVCSGVGRTSREVVDALVRCSGMDVEVVEQASGSPRTGLDASVGDPRRIAAECGWQPRIEFDASACDAITSI